MNTAAKINMKFDEYMARFVYKTISRNDPFIEPVKQEPSKPILDPIGIKKRSRAILASRSDSQRVVDRYIKENKKDLLARRHELSDEQNEAIDRFLELEMLAGNV